LTCLAPGRAGALGDQAERVERRLVPGLAGERGWPAPEVYTEIGLPGWPRPGSVL